ncbi:MAG: vitamin K epoxide reductase family protein, partial [SAR324 cluster bacterium]|nr:vitamin K epoxide reductase family protein [SAR324 cluster bacterium]
CERLQREILPAIKKRFGDQITILSLNTADQKGGQLYLNSLLDLGIPFSQPLPIVVLGTQKWSEPADITRQLPQKVETALKNSGIEWPPISGLQDLLDGLKALPELEKTRWFISAGKGPIGFMISDMAAKFNHDPVGNGYGVVVLISMLIVLGFSIYLFFWPNSPEIDLFSQWIILILAIIGIAITWQLAEIDQILQAQKSFGDSQESLLAFSVLIGMISSFGFNLWALFKSSPEKIALWQRWIIPVLLFVSFIASGYLAYVGATNTEAVCGAVGNCNSVQQSEYASLFGVISVGMLGLLGQILILFCWIMGQFGPLQWQGQFRILLWGILLGGVSFFMYLTFLEPFVIGATCFWCITTAIAMTQQLFISVRQASQAKNRLKLSIRFN